MTNLFLLSLPPKPKDKMYIPPFKRNYKEKAYVSWLDKDKSFDVDNEVSKLVFKPTIRVQKKYVFCAYLSPLWCCWSH